jgi:hypothetical protein
LHIYTFVAVKQLTSSTAPKKSMSFWDLCSKSCS